MRYSTEKFPCLCPDVKVPLCIELMTQDGWHVPEREAKMSLKNVACGPPCRQRYKGQSFKKSFALKHISGSQLYV